VAEVELTLTPSGDARPVELLHWFEPFQRWLRLEATRPLPLVVEGAPPTWPTTASIATCRPRARRRL